MRLLRALVAGQKLAVDFLRIQLLLFFDLGRLQLLATDTEPASLRLLGETTDRIFRIVSRRQGVLGARESILATPEQKALAEFLCLLVGFGDEGRNQVAEIFGAGLVTLPLRFVGVVLPQVAGCRESRAETEVRISTLRAPQHGFRAER